MRKSSSTPKNLGNEARAIWRKLTSEYAITDEGGLEILRTGLEAFDRMRDAQKQIDKDGLTTADRFGQVKAHPLLAAERDARAAYLHALRNLNLDLEPANHKVGRPGKGLF